MISGMISDICDKLEDDLTLLDNEQFYERLQLINEMAKMEIDNIDVMTEFRNEVRAVLSELDQNKLKALINKNKK